jgi:hypothetical protein
MGRAALGAVRALERVPRGPAEEPTWFAAFGRVVGWPWLAALGALSLVPGLWRAFRAGGAPLALRVVHGLAAAVVLWRHPVPGLWVLLVPHLLLPWRRTWWTALVALVPTLALAGLGAAAWGRGMVDGVWLAPWEAATLAVALALAFLGLGGRAKAGRGGRGRRPAGLPKRRGR